MSFYVSPRDLERVAREMGCRPSEAVRRLIDNFLLATDIDEARRVPGRAPGQIFRASARYGLRRTPEREDVEPVE